MNLARFGLTRDKQGQVVEEDSVDLVEISKEEAERRSIDVEVIEPEDLHEQVLEGVRSLGLYDHHDQHSFDAAFSPHLGRFLTFRGPSESQPPSSEKRYVKRQKNTSKRFIQRMKEKFDLLDLDKQIHEMKSSELLAHFKDKDGQTIDKPKFARNMIWQIYTEIQAGRTPEFAKVSCNIRSIYYYSKTVILDNKNLFGEGDVYQNFTDAIQELVLAGLLSYKDFKIVDDRRSYRLLPPEYGNTNVILLAEKDSFVGRFFQLGSQYGVIVQITKGLGSVLMADSLLTEMYEEGYDMSKQLSILSFCDFDPVGTSIPFHFAKHLRGLGFSNIRNFEQYGKLTKTERLSNGKRRTITQVRPCLDIVRPHDLSTEIRHRVKHDMLPSVRDNPSTADWAFITGGVTGTHLNKTQAISSEMLLPYLAEHLEEKIRPLLEKPPENFSRRLNYNYLLTAIREYIGARVERSLMDGF